jgi:hypothetical protein
VGQRPIDTHTEYAYKGNSKGGNWAASKQRIKENIMVAKAPKFKYTPEIEAALLASYREVGNAGIPDIAKGYSVTPRSVISKLAQLGAYVKDVPVAKKPRDEGPTKKEIMADIAAAGFAVDGLEGATKDALVRLRGRLVPEDAE